MSRARRGQAILQRPARWWACGFHCFACGAAGDGFALIAAAHDLDRERDFGEIVAIANSIASEATATAGARTPPVVKGVSTYPPTGEVSALWNAAGPVEGDAAAAAWVRARGLDPSIIEDFDLARVLARDGTTPSWAACGASWCTSDHRLLVPTYDAAGELRSLRGRAIGTAGARKELSPRGHRTGGLVLANEAALGMLRGKAGADLVVVEGTPDFLTWATRPTFSGAVVGIIGGVGMPQDVAGRIPNGTRVAVRVDRDDAGRKYEARIVELLAGRCDLFVEEASS